MAARLLVIMVVVLGLLAGSLGVPLALSVAQSEQQDMFTDRLTDTVYFTSLAERPLVDAQLSGLQDELSRYDATFGIAVLVYDGARNLVASSRAAPVDIGAEGQERLQLALAKQPSARYPLLMPWDERPLVLAEPVLMDADVLGAVVTVSPTGKVRADELRFWTLVAVMVLLAMALGVLVALPLVRWILRPVRRLDEGTGRVASAVLAGAAPVAVADGTGPPELRRLSESFDAMAETVVAAYSAQRAFVADASHQLRNPLTALRLRLSNLDGHVAAEAGEEHVAALEEAERLSTLLDGLLALARAERSAPNVEAEVDPAVEDRLEAWRPLAEHTGLELRRTGRRGLRVCGPEGAVATVLDAVLDNAVKFTPRGGTITVHTAGSGDHVEIAVTDSGPGLAAEELERATDRFWRGPGHSNVEGTGLGLAIAARTVELGGGGLRLELPSGGGLRVVARLPVPEARS